MIAKNIGCSLLGAGLCALALAAHPGPPYVNEREFTNLTLGAWRLRVLACRPGGGLDLFSCEKPVARLETPGAEFGFPTQEGLEVRYRSRDDLRFALVDGRGADGGVVFQVGRGLELTPEGGDPAVLDAVLDLRRLASGHVDLLEPEWPRP